MRSTTLVLLSFTYLASATDEGSAFGDDAPVFAEKRSKLTLRKPMATYEESAFEDVDDLNAGTAKRRMTLSSKPDMEKKPEPVQEESAFGDVDILQDVAQIAPSSPPTLRKRSARVPRGEVPQDDEGDKDDSSSDNGIQQLAEQESLVEESALGGALQDDKEDDLDDKEMKDESEQELNEKWDLKSGFAEEAEKAQGGEERERRSEEVRASEEKKKCTGPQCTAEAWSPVRNVHAYGPSGKPKDWKPRKIFGNGKEPMAEEQPRERGPRIYSRHMAVDHQAPPKRSLGEFMSSVLER